MRQMTPISLSLERGRLPGSVNMEIREIEKCEHSVCAVIYNNAWNFALASAHRTISVVDFEREIDGELTLVAIVDERIVGYISIWEPDWFIHHLYVDPIAHGTGIGTALISYLAGLAASHQISLKCQLANTRAIGFYKSLGFSETPENGTDEFGDWLRLVRTPV